MQNYFYQNYEYFEKLLNAMSDGFSYKIIFAGFYGIFAFLFDPTKTLSLTYNGTGVNYGSASDRRIKENFASSSLGLDSLLQIDVEDYNFIGQATSSRTTGFIAQNMAKIFPGAVIMNGDNGENPLSATATPWQVDYSKVTPLIVKAIQDMNAKIFGTKEVDAISIEELTASSTIPVDVKLRALGTNMKQVNDYLAELASSTSATSTTITDNITTTSTTSVICAVDTMVGVSMNEGIVTKVTPVIPEVIVNGNSTPTSANCEISKTTTTASSSVETTFIGRVIERLLAEVKNLLENVGVEQVKTKKLCLVGDDGKETCYSKEDIEKVIHSAPPAKSDTPSAPATETPTTPETPVTPDIPTTPANPETPATPAPTDTPAPTPTSTDTGTTPTE